MKIKFKIPVPLSGSHLMLLDDRKLTDYSLVIDYKFYRSLPAWTFQEAVCLFENSLSYYDACIECGFFEKKLSFAFVRAIEFGLFGEVIVNTEGHTLISSVEICKWFHNIYERNSYDRISEDQLFSVPE